MEHDLVAALRNQSQVLEKVKQQLRECQTREEELQQQLVNERQLAETLRQKRLVEERFHRESAFQLGAQQVCQPPPCAMTRALIIAGL